MATLRPTSSLRLRLRGYVGGQILPAGDGAGGGGRMIARMLEHAAPGLRALAEAVGDKVAGLGVQLLVAWAQGMGG